MFTPTQWVNSTLGKAIDTDGYPTNQKYQCWDYFDYFCRKIGFTGSRYCGNTGYAGDIWTLRDLENYHYYTDFDYIYDPNEFRDGDWIFWPQHVAIFMESNREIGQNQQGKPYVSEMALNRNGILGAMRYKHWANIEIPYGRSVIQINEHFYTVSRMQKGDYIGVFSGGLNTVSDIHDFDAPDIVNSFKITGACYFQMKDTEADPYGTTYGDISAPLNGVYQTLPNQDTTLFYDLETGLFGDCTGIVIDSSHNVFSPSLVYPNSKGNWEYARMVGLGHKDLKSWYTFVVRYEDGYVTGIANQQMTPQEIADDFSSTNMMNIAFLDGGGSAQCLSWDNEKNEMIDVRYTGRKTAASINTFRKMQYVEPPVEEPPVVIPPVEEPPAQEPEDGKDEDDMNENPNVTPQEPPVITPNPDWKDPDTIDPELNPWTVILLNIANLFKVKSILTFSLTGAYIALLFSNIEIPKFLETILTMVIGFYYGAQFEKPKK